MAHKKAGGSTPNVVTVKVNAAELKFLAVKPYPLVAFWCASLEPKFTPAWEWGLDATLPFLPHAMAWLNTKNTFVKIEAKPACT